MRISSVREFRDRATSLLRSDDPILITRRGRVAGIFLPWREASLPVDLKRAVSQDETMKKKFAELFGG